MDKERLPAVTEEEFKGWALHPVTVRYKAFLHSLVEEAKVAWAEGAFTRETTEATAQLNAEAIGRVGAIKDLLELDYEQLVGGGE